MKHRTFTETLPILSPNKEKQNPLPAGVFRIQNKLMKDYELKRHSVLRIETNGLHVYREVWGTPNRAVFMDYETRLELNLQEKNQGDQVEFKFTKVKPHRLYWHHPDVSLRLGYRLGAFGAVVGLMGLITGVLSLLQ